MGGEVSHVDTENCFGSHLCIRWRRNEGETEPKGKQLLSLHYDMPNAEYLLCGEMSQNNCISNMKSSEREFKPMRLGRLNTRN